MILRTAMITTFNGFAMSCVYILYLFGYLGQC